MEIHDKDTFTLNLFLHDIDDVFVERGDTLRDPKHLVSEESKAIKTFDRVIANPPFSQDKWWDKVEIEIKKDARGKEKTPNYQHILNKPRVLVEYYALLILPDDLYSISVMTI